MGVGGVLAMLSSGTLYSYAAFSDALETQLSFNSSNSGWIVKVGNIGLCMAITAGMASDYIGVRFCTLVGGVLGGLGFLLMWAVCAGHIAKGVVQMSFFYLLAGQGCIFTYMPGLLNYKNAPKRFHGIS